MIPLFYILETKKQHKKASKLIETINVFDSNQIGRFRKKTGWGAYGCVLSSNTKYIYIYLSR